MYSLYNNVFSVLLCIFMFSYLSGNLVAKEIFLSESLLYSPAREFRRQSVVKPLVYNAKDNRRIPTATTPQKDGSHEDELTVTMEVDGVKYTLDLQLNRDLIPFNHSVLYQENGSMVQYAAHQELCHYMGRVRNRNNSMVALSTCNGLNGIIFDGNSMKSIEASKDGNLESEHLLYDHEPYEYEGHVDEVVDIGNDHHEKDKQTLNDAEDMQTKLNKILRFKRWTPEKSIRDPFRSNQHSRYIELFLVVDHRLYKELGLEKAYERCKDIANIVDMLYSPLNIFVMLVKVEIWAEGDRITLSDDMSATVLEFNNYLRKKFVKRTYDYAQLITKQTFTKGVIGQALVGGLCSLKNSGAVATDDAGQVSSVATIVAHELGHNIGMQHDSKNCQCPDTSCIMTPSAGAWTPVHWSSCSLQYILMQFQKGMDYCLKNKPIRLFETSCGNGVIETGEQCDCGLTASDSIGGCGLCCDPDTCMLRDNATCASGRCCDIQTCQTSPAGKVCRSADHECDLPEYCTGQSELCPDDIFKMDAEVCKHGKAFCYRGTCQSRSEQCRLLWGPSGTSATDPCYQLNTNGSRSGNCGYEESRSSYVPCAPADVYCGTLQCDQLHDHIEFAIDGYDGNQWMINQYVYKGVQHRCRSVTIDMGGNAKDPGLVHDGAVCGEGKMCVKQKCLAVESVRVIPRVAGPDCSGRGVRNSLGHCHCDAGYGPPNCDVQGPGGSEDSGPASAPSENQIFLIVVYVMIGLVITFAIFLLIFLRIFKINVFARSSNCHCFY